MQARLIAHYASEQRRILDLARQSRLPLTVLATNDAHWETLAASLQA